jgi:hypothetical protein
VKKHVPLDTSVLQLLINDLLTQTLLPKGPPPAHPAVKELTTLQVRLVSLENTLSNLAKTQTPLKVQVPAKASKPSATKPSAQTGKEPSTQKTPPKPATYTSKAAAPQRPSVIVEAAAYTWSGDKPSPADICLTINAYLNNSNPTQVRVAAARWTPKGKLVLWGSPNTTMPQLTTALPHFSEALQTALVAAAASAPQALPKVRHNIKWSKLRINAIPTGKSETCGAFTSLEVHNALKVENPAYSSLTITHTPSWVQDPSTYTYGSTSSLSFAFEDLDRSAAQSLLSKRTLFVFGHVITVKRWKDTPPKKKHPLPPA